MAYEEKIPVRPHALTLEDRRRLGVSGVEEVTSFDEEEVRVRTVRGLLTVRGNGLRVDSLDKNTGALSVVGEIAELLYEEDRTEGGFWHRLLH